MSDLEMADCYYVKRLTEDGLLKDPENRWGEPAFDHYGYASEDDALEAIRKDPGDYLILRGTIVRFKS